MDINIAILQTMDTPCSLSCSGESELPACLNWAGRWKLTAVRSVNVVCDVMSTSETSAVESIVATLKPLAAGSTRRIEQQYRRISEGISYLANARNTVPAASSPVQLPDMDGSHDTDSDSEVGEGDSNAGRTGHPDLTASIAGNPSGSTSKDGANNLVWSSWDILPNSATITGQPDDAGGRRVLIAVYAAGLSIWDIQDANEAKEIFNLSRSPVKGGHVTCARLLPSLRNRDTAQPSALKDFPLLAIL
jgi:hypothetical protein